MQSVFCASANLTNGWLKLEVHMVDRYTKIILTVIAGCLIVIAFRGPSSVEKAAAEPATHVIVDAVAKSALEWAGPIQVRNN
jgi:hypothetical protein